MAYCTHGRTHMRNFWNASSEDFLKEFEANVCRISNEYYHSIMGALYHIYHGLIPQVVRFNRLGSALIALTARPNG